MGRAGGWSGQVGEQVGGQGRWVAGQVVSRVGLGMGRRWQADGYFG